MLLDASGHQPVPPGNLRVVAILLRADQGDPRVARPGPVLEDHPGGELEEPVLAAGGQRRHAAPGGDVEPIRATGPQPLHRGPIPRVPALWRSAGYGARVGQQGRVQPHLRPSPHPGPVQQAGVLAASERIGGLEVRTSPVGSVHVAVHRDRAPHLDRLTKPGDEGVGRTRVGKDVVPRGRIGVQIAGQVHGFVEDHPVGQLAWLPERSHRIEGDEQRHTFARRLEDAGHLECHEGPEASAPQDVRPVCLDASDVSHVAPSELRDPDVDDAPAVHPPRLEGVERLFRTESPGQCAEADTVAVSRGHEEQRGPRSGDGEGSKRSARNIPAVRPQNLLELAHRRRLEDRGERESHPGVLLDPGKESHGQQGVPARIEEIVLRTERRHPEDLSPCLEQLLLQRVSGCRCAVSCRRRTRRRRRQRALLQLPVRVQRKGVERDDDRGKLVGREPLAKLVADASRGVAVE